jgi:endo-1,4-beta-mannosidase
MLDVEIMGWHHLAAADVDVWWDGRPRKLKSIRDPAYKEAGSEFVSSELPLRFCKRA